MSNNNDNSIFFLTISLVCVWLIVDYVVGKKYLGKFISMLPFMSDSSGEINTSTGERVGSVANVQKAYENEKDTSNEQTQEQAQEMYNLSGGRYGTSSNNTSNYKWNYTDEQLDTMYHASMGRQGKCNCKGDI